MPSDTLQEEKETNDLDRQAANELMKEAKRGAELSAVYGPSGWLKSKKPKTNKVFLGNTLLQTVLENERCNRKQVETRKDANQQQSNVDNLKTSYRNSRVKANQVNGRKEMTPVKSNHHRKSTQARRDKERKKYSHSTLKN